MDANLITVLAGVLGSVTGASAAIATTWIAQKNDLVERYDDPVICTYPLSKFGIVVVEKARQNKIDKRPEIWLKRDSLPPRRSVSRATIRAIVSEDSEQSIATEDTLRLMRNNGISPPTVARITRVRTMASSRPKMWTEVSGCQSAPPVLPTLYYVFCAKLKFIK